MAPRRWLNYGCVRYEGERSMIRVYITSQSSIYCKGLKYCGEYSHPHSPPTPILRITFIWNTKKNLNKNKNSIPDVNTCFSPFLLPFLLTSLAYILLPCSTTTPPRPYFFFFLFFFSPIFLSLFSLSSLFYLWFYKKLQELN